MFPVVIFHMRLRVPMGHIHVRSYLLCSLSENISSVDNGSERCHFENGFLHAYEIPVQRSLDSKNYQPSPTQ